MGGRYVRVGPANVMPYLQPMGLQLAAPAGLRQSGPGLEVVADGHLPGWLLLQALHVGRLFSEGSLVRSALCGTEVSAGNLSASPLSSVASAKKPRPLQPGPVSAGLAPRRQGPS